jgi:hypothetical protein
MEKKYTTSDLYVSSLLRAKGKELDKIQQIGRKCWFIFKGYEACNNLVLEHWKGNVEVNSKSFIEAIKTLKNLIFEEMDRGNLPN